MEDISSERSVSRRSMSSQSSARLAERVRRHASRVTLDCHQRRLIEWARSGEGPYPDADESLRLAIEELTVLIAGLGSLSEIDTVRFDSDAGLIHRPRE
ncbi:MULTISPECIES: hypothetical protein [Gordonia]|uniref:hypothetical protein n=1 Tax=Gordonia TaxID=2053 RepID=UPI000AE9AD64|nr:MULTISPECIES: hypothetical protein [Gordonia]